MEEENVLAEENVGPEEKTIENNNEPNDVEVEEEGEEEQEAEVEATEDLNKETVEVDKSENEEETIEYEESPEKPNEQEGPPDVELEQELLKETSSKEAVDKMDMVEADELQENMGGVTVDNMETDENNEEKEIVIEETHEEDEHENEEQVGKKLEEEPSEFTRAGRGSIAYEMRPRIRDDKDNVSGFSEDFFLDEDLPLKFYKYMAERDEEEEEEESVYEEEVITINRTPYYEKYGELLEGLTRESIRNFVLQKKMAKIFKRRKMDHVLKEVDRQFDTQEKYGKKLDAYGELLDVDHSQRTSIITELENLKSEKESKCLELKKLFEELQAQEKNTGYGLIHTKTGKPIPDKLTERLVNRQRLQMQTVGDMRLRHIQLKNMVTEKQNEISSLDTIGDNLYLMDYEQLKVENRSYIDKMEEKDEELARLRNKCQKTIQILAHMREKSAALESDIDFLNNNTGHLQLKSMVVSKLFSG